MAVHDPAASGGALESSGYEPVHVSPPTNCVPL